jgi:hypothetical protein
MNCTSFKSLVHEYLDETLAPEALAAARQHLQNCADCRRVLEGERHLAQTMRQGFQTATAGLTLRPDLQRRVLQVLESEPRPSASDLVSWRAEVFRYLGLGFLSTFVNRQSALGAALLSVLMLSLALHFYLRMTKHPISQTVTLTTPYARIVDVPVPTQKYVFRQDNGTVTDALSASVAIARAGFFEDSGLVPRP